MKERLVVIGNGMAGMRTVEELLKLAPDLYDITVFGEEPHGNYNRILLSPVLGGELSFEETLLHRPGWYAENGITLRSGTRVEKIDRRRRVVIAADGSETPYDRMLLATGSRPVILPVAGHGLPGVIGFRSVADVEVMIDAAQRFHHAVVIGGGLLGLEAAAGLLKHGMKVRVVHLADTLMERQLDETAGRMLQQNLESRGVEFLMGAKTREIIGRKRVQGVLFEDGREVSADLVVMAVGIRPEKELARSADIYCDRGVVVDDTLQTFDPRIYAVGECVQHRSATYGLVAPLFEQARVCANHLAQLAFRRYTGSITSTKLKVTGVDLFSAGDFSDDAQSESIVFGDPSRGVYKKLVLEENRLKGAVLYGDTVDGSWYFDLMRDGVDVAAFRDALMFGRAHIGDAGPGGGTSTAEMADDAQVCDCNGVTKGDIVTAIRRHGLFTLNEVKKHTKAAASCGGCSGLVEQILGATVGGEHTRPDEKPLCTCTDFSHDEVRHAVREQHLIDRESVMRALDWRSPDGCPTCRPALNYYLLARWPGEAVDDRQSRFVNERLHANIQKDGSYTVVPRLWGGVATPDELRAIADTADKHAVPLVKLTGGQRIDLVGVKREQLPDIWGDLNTAGLVSGHAYGKALRTVKTCIGAQFCRFGTQDSIQMGIDLEKMTWGSWTPHKFKMAVSACPRNCAEASIKDFGVIGIEGAWELLVGGNGGTKVRVTDKLCRVKTAAEVLEYAGAFMQLYREEARYLERTAPWVERIGLTYIRTQVVDDTERRRELYERFLESQRYARHDPWAANRAPEQRLEFVPMQTLSSDARVAQSG
ncbi:nitrite reductase large subunit NirB [Thiohalomonas denitrificans]|uniref:Assimilatory nitrite reductase (NAD(P)H) large subunit n=1 Tax=Thiohalomonas denitrificans TaxID=415747 RepID=A0A1G5Q889_9GAMM|nr:nitrite reductase large subunit NirB [Thiohalomonas denitrificans]SCZ58095.1 assimilatory nitrite reductase (NAD(P)H) large subunit precursor [Thiohalomonas denitrificans]